MFYPFFEDDEEEEEEEVDRTQIPIAGATNVFKEVLVPDVVRRIGHTLSVFDIQALAATGKGTLSVDDENTMIEYILLTQFLEPYARASDRVTLSSHPYARLFSILTALYPDLPQRRPELVGRATATWTVVDWQHLLGGIREIAGPNDVWARHVYRVVCEETGVALAQALVEAPRLFEDELVDRVDADGFVTVLVVRDARGTPLWQLAETTRTASFISGGSGGDGSGFVRLPETLYVFQRIGQPYALSAAEERTLGQVCRDLLLDEPDRAAADPNRPVLWRLSSGLKTLLYYEHLHNHPLPLKLTLRVADERPRRRELSVATGFLWESRE